VGEALDLTMNNLLTSLFEFLSLHDSNVRWVLVGSIILGMSTGAVGCFAFLQRRSLVGDTLAHAALPGVTIAFLLTQSRNPITILIGATVSCGLGFLCCEYLIHRTKVKEDSALAIVLSVFFALGIFLLSIIQRMPLGNQAGLDKLLFGQAASLVQRDIIVLSSFAILVLAYIILFYRQLRVLIFDPIYARTIGLNTRALHTSLSVTLIFAVVIGLQLVGVVLVAALLLTPAAGARYWTNQLWKMIALASFFGGLAGLIGTQISYSAPRMPTGPWMVVAITIIFGFSLVLAPSRGLFARWYRNRRNNRRTAEENILRSMFKFAEAGPGRDLLIEPGQILSFSRLSSAALDRIIQRLLKRHELRRSGLHIGFTESGFHHAEALTRRHRLWEAYLTEQLQIPADHVHADAEEIEHILSPELEVALVAEIQQAEKDPHGKIIPAQRAGKGDGNES
jgi:manganese/zinc/iron transport system permease protein